MSQMGMMDPAMGANMMAQMGSFMGQQQGYGGGGYDQAWIHY